MLLVLSFGMVYYIAKDNGNKRTHPIIQFSQLQKEPNSGHAIQPILLSFFFFFKVKFLMWIEVFSIIDQDKEI